MIVKVLLIVAITYLIGKFVATIFPYLMPSFDNLDLDVSDSDDTPIELPEEESDSYVDESVTR